MKIMRFIKDYMSGLFFLFCLALAFSAGYLGHPTYTLDSVQLDIKHDPQGSYYTQEDEKKYVDLNSFVKENHAKLNPKAIETANITHDKPVISEELVFSKKKIRTGELISYKVVTVRTHWGMWSLLPALVALVLCWMTREPITSLFSGILVGAFLLGKYDITEAVLVPELSTRSAAGIIVLYLWLLGGLMGIWSKTGAAGAFAALMTKHFVRGPVSAKLVAWCLGVVFFQGGTVSSVLVGTSVKPIADKHRVSHEELSYIVDSTASPIASQLAFNAWPGYVQAFIYVGGVSWLATEADRITFFFKSVPLCFYAIFAVLSTFLMSIDRAPFLGKQMKDAIKRARTTGELDAPGARPLSARELQESHVPEGYTPHVIEFFLPLGLLIGIAIGSFYMWGAPNVRWAFGIALLVAFTMAIVRGMSVSQVIEGLTTGLKGVVGGSVILLLAIIIGSVSKEVGGGIYLVDLLREAIPYWILPVILQVMTMVIAFSTGTSWGTYAITFPLAMPLSWAIAQNQDLAHPEFFMMVCFAAVMDGSVYGDQCSPISDTTVLSAMCTGCDLMDHVKTQIRPATCAAGIAAILWTGITVAFA